MKRCTNCCELKPLEEFYAAKGMRDGRRNDCIPCNLAASKRRNAANPMPNRERARRWQRENPERREKYQQLYRASGRKAISDRRSYLKRSFGMTLEQYDAMLSAQGGGCAICGRPPSARISLHVDHDHDTGRIRALLCFPCNNALGLLQESEGVVLKMLGYLQMTEEARGLNALTRQRLRALRAG